MGLFDRFTVLGALVLAAVTRVLSLPRFRALEAACVLACIGFVLLIGHVTAAIAPDPLASAEAARSGWVGIHGCMTAPTALGGRLWSLIIAMVLAAACSVGLLPARRASAAVGNVAAILFPRPRVGWLRDTDAGWLPIMMAGVAIAAE